RWCDGHLPLSRPARAPVSGPESLPGPVHRRGCSLSAPPAVASPPAQAQSRSAASASAIVERLRTRAREMTWDRRRPVSRVCTRRLLLYERRLFDEIAASRGGRVWTLDRC